MSHERPASGCSEVAFVRRYALGGSAEVALEDYARVLTRAERAEALHEGGGAGGVSGVHLCGSGSAATVERRRDIEDFARDLATRAGESRLGWA